MMFKTMSGRTIQGEIEEFYVDLLGRHMARIRISGNDFYCIPVESLTVEVV
ncbi:hypothetical protein ACWGA9_06310 [Streptomyces sp. NPDC054950]